VTRSGGFRAFESWDGKSLYYFRDRAVWKSDLDGGNESSVIGVRDFQDWRVCGSFLDPSSAPAGQFIRYEPSVRSKHMRPLDVGRRIDGNMGIDVSPDGRWVIYTRADSLESDTMMVENFH
jgi:hypothetical protein